MYSFPLFSRTQRTSYPGLSVIPVAAYTRSDNSATAASSRDAGVRATATAEDVFRDPSSERAAFAPRVDAASAETPRGRLGAECRLSFPRLTCLSTKSTTSAFDENFLFSGPGAKKRMRPTILRLAADHERSMETRQFAPSITPVSSNTCLRSSRRAVASSLENSSSSMRSRSICSGDLTASPSTAIARALKSLTWFTSAVPLRNFFPPGEKMNR